MDKICKACGKSYNTSNKQYCSMECFRNSPRIITKYKQHDDSPTSHIVINSPEFAYTLGFLWGDGSLKEKKCKLYSFYYPIIHIVYEDYLPLDSLFSKLGTWKKRIIQPGKRQPQVQCSAVLYDKSIGKFLVDNDYKIKSIVSPTKILCITPDHLKHYWWRGFFDADGCFYADKNNTIQFTLAGSFDQDWSDFESLLTKLDIKFKTTRRETKTGKSSIVRVCGVFGVERLGNYIYKDDMSISLPRKLSKFQYIQRLAQIAAAKTKNKGRSGNLKRNICCPN